MAEESGNNLSPEARRELLKLAREAIKHYLEHQEQLPYSSEDTELSRRFGAFVTLRLNCQLRGCIGFITSEKPLWQTIIDAAVSAAFNDPRFGPVTPDEVDNLEIEISVLSTPVVVSDTEEIEVGRDGLIITDGHHRGLLLPQVASEYGWDREQFLEYTCRKAALPPDAWRKGAVIERFEAQVFGEKEFV